MATDANVQVSPDSTGKKIRTLEITALQNDGSLATVEMQVVSMSDEMGNPLSFGNVEGLLETMIDKLEQIRFLMELTS